VKKEECDFLFSTPQIFELNLKRPALLFHFSIFFFHFLLGWLNTVEREEKRREEGRRSQTSYRITQHLLMVPSETTKGDLVKNKTDERSLSLSSAG